MGGAVALIILAPIFHPITMSMGIFTIYLEIIRVLSLVSGTGTLPMGACLFIGRKIEGIFVERASKGIALYLLGEIIVPFLITYIPFLVTWLPNVLGMKSDRRINSCVVSEKI